jgi:hypothetical protein
MISMLIFRNDPWEPGPVADVTTTVTASFHVGVSPFAEWSEVLLLVHVHIVPAAGRVENGVLAQVEPEQVPCTAFVLGKLARLLVNDRFACPPALGLGRLCRSLRGKSGLLQLALELLQLEEAIGPAANACIARQGQHLTDCIAELVEVWLDPGRHTALAAALAPQDKVKI